MLRSSLETQAGSRFQIIGPLGEGGKELDNTAGDSIARFKHEFRAVADCHHPNLVRLHELIEQDGRWSIVMELVPGCDLTE